MRLAPPCPVSLGRAYWGAWGALKVGWPLAGLLVLVPLCPLVAEFTRGVFHLVQRQRHCSVFTDLYLKKCAHKLTFKVAEILEELHLHTKV